MTKFLNISTDNTLGGNSPSNETVSSQKAIKEYVDSHGGGSAPIWGNITGTLSNQTDLQNALDAKADDSDVVKLTGNQTVAGVKSFSDNIETLGLIKGSNETGSSATNHAMDLGHRGKNYVDFYEYGGIFNFYKSQGGTNTLLGKVAALTTSTSDETLATTANVDAKITAQAVKLTGNQTIAGEKTFTSVVTKQLSTGNSSPSYNDTYKVTDTDLDTTTNPAYSKTYYNAVRDKNNYYLTYITSTYNTDGSSYITLTARTRNTDNSGNVQANLGVRVYRDGSVVTNAPTPAISDNSTQIATTAFVKAQGYLGASDLTEVQCVVETYHNGSSWYRVWSDGWIEQGGVITNATYNGVTVSLLKNFSNTDYIGFVTAKRTSNNGQGDVNPQFDKIDNTQAKIGCGVHGGSTCQWVAFGY